MYIGVDAHKGGWVAIELNDSGFVRASCAPSFGELLSGCTNARHIGVDIPIGLTDASPRTADQAARDSLVGQASSVFNAPVRAALVANTYDEAQAISRRHTGKGLSRQSYGLFEKIREVDAHKSDTRIFEAHPELCFRQLKGGPIANSKHSWGGSQQRRDALERGGVLLPNSLGDADVVPVDDVLDAAVVAWTARRMAHGEARSFPAKPSEQDELGRVVAIWA